MSGICSHQAIPVFLSVKKTEKKKWKKKISYNTENTTRIQHGYTTRIKHEIYTTQKIQPKVGVLGACLEALRHSLR